MQEAGATQVQELAFTIADGMEYVKYGVASGLDIDKFAGRLSFFFAIGMNFFMEVAKLRAARVLWHRVMINLGAQDERSKMLRTHCQTSGVSLQEQDPYNNVIRTTIEAMAAMLGGTQSLHTNALDEAIALPTDFSARIARNTQIVIQEETGMCNVVDPLGGSYYIEALTSQLVDAAWAIIERVEAEGGMAKAVSAGWPKAMIEEAAAGRQARVDRGEDVIVGVNKYRLGTEDKLDTLSIDNHAVREGQIARLKWVRETRDEAACRAALAALTEGAKGQGNLLELAVDAARHRATLGEISDAMEAVFGRHGTFPTPVKGIYGAAYAGDARYQQVLDGVDAVSRRLGRAPRMLVAKMGQDGHDRGANVIASAFGDMGFDVTSGPLFQTPEEAAKLALEQGVDAVGASSLAAGHKTLVPELINRLREAGRADIKVVAGGVIPPQDYEFLREAGVQGIYGPGSNIVECAADMLRLLGHNMPPAGEELDAAE
jgi:methylmalonyl-CoA mutase